MTKEEMRQIVLEQREGFRSFHALDIQIEQKMTIQDRLAAFRRIRSTARYLPVTETRSDDLEAMRRWATIYDRFKTER